MISDIESQARMNGQDNNSKAAVVAVEMEKRKLVDVSRRPINCLALGRSVQDINLSVSNVQFFEGYIRFEAQEGKSFQIEHDGPALQWGHKRDTGDELGGFSAGAVVKSGGGAVNSVRSVAELAERYGAGVGLTLLDTSASGLSLNTELEALDIRLQILGLEDLATNLVISDSHHRDRVILKSRVSSRELADYEVESIASMMSRCDLVPNQA